jgi:hypothetical protein
VTAAHHGQTAEAVQTLVFVSIHHEGSNICPSFGETLVEFE